MIFTFSFLSQALIPREILRSNLQRIPIKTNNCDNLAISRSQTWQRILCHIYIPMKVNIHSFLKNIKAWQIAKLSMGTNTCCQDQNINPLTLKDHKFNNFFAVFFVWCISWYVVYIKIAIFWVALRYELLKLFLVSASNDHWTSSARIY